MNGVAVFVAMVFAQPCVNGVCRPQAPAPRQEVSHPAVVRVLNERGQERTYGTGTLVAMDGERGIVVSCAHLFREYTGRLTVSFADGQTRDARLLDVDHEADLSALAIAPVGVSIVTVANQAPKVGDALVSAGYGPNGQYATSHGRALGYGSLDGRTHDVLVMSGSARQGDSGGPIFNAQGELAGVLFGTDGRRVDGVHCLRVRRFLGGLLEKDVAKPQAAENGCAPACGLATCESRLRELEAQQQQLSDQLQSLREKPLAPPVAVARPRLVELLLRDNLAALLVSIGVPGGIATIGAWLLMRRTRQRLRAIVIRDQAPPPAQVIERERQFVEVQVPTDRLGALEWAMDEYVKRNPGARPTVETIEAYAKQFQSAVKK